MNNPQEAAAWSQYLKLLDQWPPHEVTQTLRAFNIPEDILRKITERHERESSRQFELDEPLAICRENAMRWYTGPRQGDRNWYPYEAKLLRSLAQDAVRRIDEASDKVVAMLDHPGTATFDSRGLVVGHVQSGKTSNFTAVIAKAADRGYRLFIVLSGVHNSLRSQTQKRLERDLVAANPDLWHQLTTLDSDFQGGANPASLVGSKHQYVLLVIKKNSAPLTKLRKWLHDAKEYLGNCPALVIDDEADQATVATKKINPLMRALLDELPKVCYVGYTATPFGNLLIDPADERDFYPKDFVLSLPQGVGYQGPETLFGRDALDGEDPADVPTGHDLIREIPDDELDVLRPARKADVPAFEPVVSGSLRRAVLWFWLATATRRARTEPDHSSMLVHAHSDVAVHDSYAAPLRHMRAVADSALQHGNPDFLSECEALWREETSRVSAESMSEEPVSWDAVVQTLPDVIRSTKVILDHYRSTDRLDYDSGIATVIAVGGNTLSRGLTLEGLVVSVFVRSSNMYDTLLQMGRWFGYRPGYSDLPRIWMPAEMRRWFSHLASVEADMRREIERYLTEHKSPLDMAVRIRCHPKMRVTAPSRLGSAVKAAASYGGELVETRYFPCHPIGSAGHEETMRWHSANETAVLTLLKAAADRSENDPKVAEHRRLYRAVPAEIVLDFLASYNVDPRSTEYSAVLVTDYIKKRLTAGGLKAWNVGLIGVTPKGENKHLLPDGRPVGAIRRSRTKATAGDDVADIKTLTGTRDPGLDLSIPAGAKDVNRSDLRRWRTEQQGDTGLLLVYPIDGQSSAEGKEDRADLKAPVAVVWGMAIVFPKPVVGAEVSVEYDYVQADLSAVYPAAAEDPADEEIAQFDADFESVETP